LIVTGDALERVFLGLDMQRMFLKRGQQIQEWFYEC
jgi:hypothetical protein